jgi:hypothetical protein
MPDIGGAFSGGLDRRRFVTLELCRGLAQRNKARKTSYFDAPSGPLTLRESPNTSLPGASGRRAVRYPQVSSGIDRSRLSGHFAKNTK